jgi:uncharacterized protein (TIGR00290 family)
MMGTKAILAWSGGKDSAMAFYDICRGGVYTIERLLTTVSQDYDRVCMHGVRTALIERQAAELGLPLDKVYLAANESQEGYDAKMHAYLTSCRQQGIEAVVFGDLFLEDVRQYRERSLSRVNMQAVFPLWRRDTQALAKTFIQTAFKAVITCVDLEALSPVFAGRDYDSTFLADLPAGVDPCGERGEFHSFVYDGPIFRRAIPFTAGLTVRRDNRFLYLDLIPGSAPMAEIPSLQQPQRDQASPLTISIPPAYNSRHGGI